MAQWVMILNMKRVPVAIGRIGTVDKYFSEHEGPFEAVPLPGETIPSQYWSGPTMNRLVGRMVSRNHPDHPGNYPGNRAQIKWEASLRRG